MITYKSKSPQFFIYKIEIHSDSITVYDNTRYQHPSHGGIMKYLVQHQGLKLHKLHNYAFLPNENNEWELKRLQTAND